MVDTTNRLNRLRDAGASEAFVETIEAAEENDIRTHALRQIESWERNSPNDEWPVHGGGHFFDALWSGDVETAWAHADKSGKAAMREAGLEPLVA